MNKYSPIRALWAIVKAGLTSTLRSPASIVFGLIFPFIFIMVFGFLDGSSLNARVFVAPGSDTSSEVYRAIVANPAVKVVEGMSEEEAKEQLSKGKIDAILDVQPMPIMPAMQADPRASAEKYIVNVTTSSASPQGGGIVMSVVNSIVLQQNLKETGVTDLAYQINPNQIEGRQFKSIDFVLPGQLGFSLLSTGVFITAFSFVMLRQALVIKRYFTTPINPALIVIGEGISRMVFSLLQSSVIIFVGTWFLGYTLVQGWATLVDMLLLTTLGLVVFMSFGFIISSIARDERTIPPLANIFTLPQFLLSGSFFPTDNFPEWLQLVSKILPLTFLNDAMRIVAFEGQGLASVAPQIWGLVVWGVVGYLIAIFTFKWE